MNLRAVVWLLGCVLLLLAGFLLVPAVISAWFHEQESFQGFLISAGVAAVFGGAMTFFSRGSTVTAEGRPDFFRREGLAVVGFSWILAGVVGAMPFLFSGTLSNPADALFESISGFTTTGATILSGEQIDGLQQGMAFWRSFTHWLGGIGIVLVFVVLFPTGGRSLYRSEVPGISREAVQQRVRDSAIGLVRVYVGLTLAEVVLLWFLERDLLDAFIHAFGTLATGGFSSHSQSIAHYDSWRYELVILVFMFLAGINFGVYDIFLRQGVKGMLRAAWGSSEIRTYGGLVLACTAFITFALWFWGGSNGPSPEGGPPDYSSLRRCLRDSGFLVVSLITSTGYGTADFDQWPNVCRMLLMVLALIGACAGSTGGGMKVGRVLILAKAAIQGVRRFARPRAIHNVRMDGRVLDDSMVTMVMAYCGLWFLVFLFGTMVIASVNIHSPGFEDQVLLTSATSVLATLNNIGPGLAMVGPTQNFGFMPDAAKLLLSFFMILGRLEFYALVVLFVPRFWRS